MRARLTKAELKSIESLYERVNKLWKAMEEKDVALNNGNGSVAEQLSCASAALTCILQEY